MAKMVSRRPLTAGIRVKFYLILCGIYGGRSGTGTSFSPSTSIFAVTIIGTALNNYYTFIPSSTTGLM
jgi:hypothetical protein